MRILFVNQYYWPDYAATAQVLTDLAERLVRSGHHVTVVCSQRPYAGNRACFPKRATRNGVRIVRVPATGGGKEVGTFRRVLDLLSFFVLASATCVRQPRPDVVVTLTSPPMIGLLGWLLASTRRVTHVHYCMDLCPDLLVATGMLSERSLIYRVFASVTQYYLRRCHAIIVLGPHMGDRIRKYGVEAERIHVVPLWADGKEVRPIPREDNWFIKEHHLQDKFVVLYSGNIGTEETLDIVIDAAEYLSRYADIVFLFISGGDSFERFQSAVRARELTNFRFLHYQNREDLPYSLSAGHVHIVYFKPGKEGMKIPSKIYGIMAAGGPVLYIGNNGNEIADIVSANDIGIHVRDGDAVGLAAAVEMMRANPHLMDDMSRRARRAFEAHYDVDAVTGRLSRLLEDLGD